MLFIILSYIATLVPYMAVHHFAILGKLFNSAVDNDGASSFILIFIVGKCWQISENLLGTSRPAFVFTGVNQTL